MQPHALPRPPLNHNTIVSTSRRTPNHPYVRLCVPVSCGQLSRERAPSCQRLFNPRRALPLQSATGLSSCGLGEKDLIFHINPNAPATTPTGTVFFKGMYKNGVVTDAGKSAH